MFSESIFCTTLEKVHFSLLYRSSISCFTSLVLFVLYQLLYAWHKLLFDFVWQLCMHNYHMCKFKLKNAKSQDDYQIVITCMACIEF